MSTTHGRLSRQAATRLQGGELILRGFDDDEIVDILDVSRSSVERWRKKIESDGLRGLARKPGSGRSSELTPEQLQDLKAIVLQGAKASGYLTDRWTSRIVADLPSLAELRELLPDRWKMAHANSFGAISPAKL